MEVVSWRRMAVRERNNADESMVLPLRTLTLFSTGESGNPSTSAALMMPEVRTGGAWGGVGEALRVEEGDLEGD